MKVLILLIILTFLNKTGHSENLTTAAEFLTWGIGGRASAMAEALSAIPSELSLFYNPAGLAFLKHKKILLMHTPLYRQIGIKDMYHEYIGYTQRNLGLGIIYTLLGKHKNQIQEAVYLPTEDYKKFTWIDYALLLGLSEKLNKKLGLGVCLKLVGSTIKNILKENNYKEYEDIKTFTLALDAGLLYKLKNYLNVAIGISNLGGDFYYKNRNLAEVLPYEIKLGLAYIYQESAKGITFAAELHRSIEEIFIYNIGLEVNIEKLFLRAGYYDKGGDLSGLSFGAGVNFSRFNIDFAYTNIPGGELSKNLRSSISINF
jgi:hypothetical protein